MKSPFPGMDPYLERHWGDVHTRLMVYASDQMRAQLPRALRVRVEEHVTIESEEERIGGAYPDIRILERPGSFEGSALPNGGVAVADAEPMEVPVDEPATERTLCIYDTTSGDRLVTVISIIVIGVIELSTSWSGSGRTVGDDVVGLRVVTANGGIVSSGRAFVRAVLVMITGGLVLLTALVSKRNNGVHDWLCRTAVVYDWRPQSRRSRPPA